MACFTVMSYTTEDIANGSYGINTKRHNSQQSTITEELVNEVLLKAMLDINNTNVDNVLYKLEHVATTPTHATIAFYYESNNNPHRHIIQVECV